MIAGVYINQLKEIASIITDISCNKTNIPRAIINIKLSDRHRIGPFIFDWTINDIASAIALALWSR